MLCKMERSQTGNHGTLHAGMVYDASQSPKLKAEMDAYVERGFARALTKAEVTEFKGVAKKAKAEAAEKAKAEAEAAEKAKAEAEAAEKAKAEAEAAEKAKA